MYIVDFLKGYWGLLCFMYGIFYKVVNIFIWINNRELLKIKKNYIKKIIRKIIILYF